MLRRRKGALTLKLEDPHFLGWWRGAPLYLRILGAVALGLVTGIALGD